MQMRSSERSINIESQSNKNEIIILAIDKPPTVLHKKFVSIYELSSVVRH